MSTPTGWTPNPPSIHTIAAALDGTTICDNTGNTCTADRHELECVSATCTYGQDCINVVHADDCPAGWDRLTGVWAADMPEVGEV